MNGQQGGRQQGHQDQHRKGEKKSGGGPLVFISRATDRDGRVRKDTIKKSEKTGAFDICVRIGQDHQNPPHPVVIRVLINDQETAILEVREPREYNFDGVKPDKDGKIVVSIERAASPGQRKSVEFVKSELDKAASQQPPAHEAEKQLKRLIVTIGQFRPDNSRIVTVVTADESGKPTKGKFIVDAGQSFVWNGNTEPGAVELETNDDGKAVFKLRLLEFDAEVIFTHVESGEKVTKFLVEEA